MATTAETIHQIQYFTGQSSGLNPEAIESKKSQLIYNFYVQNGMLKKIAGSALYIASGFGSSPIVWMDSFQRRLMWQLGTNVGIETAEGSQVESLLSANFDASPLYSDKWRESIYLGNGYDLKFYNGTDIKDLGILPPGNGSTPRKEFIVSIGLSGSPVAGIYRYTFTYFDSSTETESLPLGSLADERGLFNPGEFAAALADNPGNPTGFDFVEITNVGSFRMTVTLDAGFVATVTALAPARVDKIKIYRSISTDGGTTFSDYRLVTTQDIPRSGPLNYTDNATQGNLGPIIIPDDLVPPPTRAGVVNGGAAATTRGPKFLRFWRDSLFLFGGHFPAYTVTDSTRNVSDKNFASQSILYGSDTFLPEYFPFDWEIGSGDGQEPTGMAVVNDVLCLFKEGSIYTLTGTVLNNFIPQVQDQATGCVAPSSIQETSKGVIFLAAAGVGIFKGVGNAQIISDEILDEIQDINQSALDVVTSDYDQNQEIYTLYVPQGTSTRNNRQLQFSLKDSAWSVGRRRRNVSSATTIPKENDEQASFLATDVGGFILSTGDRSVVTDYDGDVITALWRSSDFDFGSKTKQKKIIWMYITARCSINWIVDISVYADGGPESVFQLANVNSDTAYAKYASSQSDGDGAVYDTSRYVDYQTIKRLKIPVSGIGRQFYVEILEKQSNTDRFAFDILAVELEGEMLGK